MDKVYIAAPFFNDRQIAIVEEIKAILNRQGVEYFSPKDESMFKQGDNPKTILNLNCAAIRDAPYIIVVTDDKDVGTIWEAGYAYARGIPIIYLWLGYEPHMKFNIMLAASGDAVCHSFLSLEGQIGFYKDNGIFITEQNVDMLHE